MAYPLIDPLSPGASWSGASPESTSGQPWSSIVSPAPSFQRRLWVAAQEAVLWAVKVSVAVAILVLTVSYLLGNYSIVKGRADNGQRAHEFLLRQVPEYGGRPASRPQPPPATRPGSPPASP